MSLSLDISAYAHRLHTEPVDQAFLQVYWSELLKRLLLAVLCPGSGSLAPHLDRHLEHCLSAAVRNFLLQAIDPGELDGKRALGPERLLQDRMKVR